MRPGRLLSALALLPALAGCGPAPRVDLEGLRARDHRLVNGAQVPGRELFGAGNVLVLTLDPECPLCLMHAPELAALAGAGDLQVVGLYPSPYIVPDSVRAYAARNGLGFPQVMDPDCVIASALGAVVTPEAFLLAADGTVLYRGAIDDRARRAGRKKPEAAHRYLRDAIAALARGERPDPAQVQAVGCFLECEGNPVP